MIERTFVQQKIKEYSIEEFIYSKLKNLGLSHVEIQKTPLGEKITLYGLHPGKLVGRGGKNLREITEVLKEKFNLENPQIEVKEDENPFLNPRVVAEHIALNLERYGISRFRAIIHRTMALVMKNGARGVEVRVSGKIPSDRARTWRFFVGYLKKCGNPAKTIVKSAKTTALLKIGVIGIKVKIMPPDVLLPDHVIINDVPKEELEQIVKEIHEEVKPLKVRAEKGEKNKDDQSKKRSQKKTKRKSTTKTTKTKKTTTGKKRGRKKTE